MLDHFGNMISEEVITRQVSDNIIPGLKDKLPGYTESRLEKWEDDCLRTSTIFSTEKNDLTVFVVITVIQSSDVNDADEVYKIYVNLFSRKPGAENTTWHANDSLSFDINHYDASSLIDSTAGLINTINDEIFLH